MTHNVVIIGVGSIGERHLRSFKATGRVEAAFVETNPALRETIADRYQTRAFATLDAALAEKPSAAVIAVPAPLHVPMATQLARDGVHMLIEKPLSVSLAGIEDLRQAVRDSGVTASVAYVYRSFSTLAAMKRALVEGRFGKPLQVVAVSGQHFPKYRPAYREIYYANRAAGGGAIQDALTHVLNFGEWLVGPIDRLVADAAHLALEGVTVEDSVNVLTRHGNVLGSYSLNQHQAPNESTITVICEQGTLRFESHTNRWMSMTEPGGTWTEELVGPQERDAHFIAQANAFLDAVEGKAAPLCTLEEGLQTLRVNLAVLASVEKGAWQTIE